MAGTPTSRMFFRSKKNGWKSFVVPFDFVNQTSYDCWFNDDPYGCAFVHNLIFRPSCYRCGFKKVNRVSDINVADFWGIQDVCPSIDDDKGTSLIIVHSDKGQLIFNEISEKMVYQPVDFKAAIAHNSSMIRSVKIPKNRAAFMERVQTDDFSAVGLLGVLIQIKNRFKK